MGNYRMNCGISGLKIQEGDRVCFIPLLENKHAKRNERANIPFFLSEPSELFAPAAFPIFGESDGEGGLTHIVEDSNTNAIETRYDISINKYIEIATSVRSMNDEYGDLLYLVSKDEELFRKPLSIEELLLHLGFEASGSVFTHKEIPTASVLFENNHLSLLNPKSEVLSKVHIQQPQRLLDEIYAFCGVQLNLLPELLWKFEELNGLTGMFVLGSVYNFLTNEDNSIHSLDKEEIKGYIEELNVELRDNIRSIANYKKLLELNIVTIEEFWKYEKDLSILVDYRFDQLDIAAPFKEWSLFLKMYQEEIKAGELSNQIIDYWFLFYSMLKTNKQFVPSLKAEQFGDNEAIELLSKKILELS